MGFSQKRRFVRHLCADIAVIPECSQGSIQSPAEDGFDCRWFGENPKKGLGVLVAKPWRILDYREPQQKWVAPVWIGGPCDFLLLAVWTARIKESHKIRGVTSHRPVRQWSAILTGSMEGLWSCVEISTAT
jgi:hypothetical protein